MKRGELAVKLERWEPLAPCAACFLLTAVLCGAQLFGGYAPFALGLVAAAGCGKRGLAALLGGVAGALVFLDFSHALRTLAVAVLLYTANNAFCETRWYRSRRFLPAMTALMYLAVELVYLLQAGADRAALCLLSIALAVLAAVCARAVLEGKTMNEEQRQAALLVVVTGVLMAASALRLENGFAPGRILAMLLVMLLAYDRSAGTALAAALGIGLAMDLTAQPGSFLHAAVYGFGALSMGRERRGRRVGAALLWCVSLLLLSLPLDAEQGLILLYEGLCATLLFLVLPNRLFGGKRLAAEKPEADTAETEEAEHSTARRRLSATALALRELYDSLMRTPKAEDENPAMIFDRAAERVCRGCSLRTICWERDYAKTYNALNDATPALLTQGRGRGGDFPSYFTDRCIRFPSFLSAVNSELSAFLLRRQYRGRLGRHARAGGGAVRPALRAAQRRGGNAGGTADGGGDAADLSRGRGAAAQGGRERQRRQRDAFRDRGRTALPAALRRHGLRGGGAARVGAGGASLRALSAGGRGDLRRAQNAQQRPDAACRGVRELYDHRPSDAFAARRRGGGL